MKNELHLPEDKEIHINPTEAHKSLPWIRVCKNGPYFEDENGSVWTPIGQNDAITWPDFQGLFMRKNVAEVEGHLSYLAAHGVTCIRMMMEYCQTENRYFEKPAGRFQPNMVQFWDDLIALCEKYGIRILLTPFDTFWMARRWKFHPYNQLSGGPCKSKWQWLSCPATIAAIKERFGFFIERWGASGAIFGWDLWNEISPLHARKSVEMLHDYVTEISTHIREKEQVLYGKYRPQTVSVLDSVLSHPGMPSLIFRHPLLDFGSTHFYETGSIDSPRNVYAAAVTTGSMVRVALAQLPPERPFLDSEHGPLAFFRRNKKGLPEEFDDRYHRHMQWAHLASGGAGGGMRWPYRHPHVLTHGMRRSQQNLANFTGLIDWPRFRRSNLNEEILINVPGIRVFGCGDADQAVVWLLLTEKLKKKTTSAPLWVEIGIPGLSDGSFKISFWDTVRGHVSSQKITKSGQYLSIGTFLTSGDLALAIQNG